MNSYITVLERNRVLKNAHVIFYTRFLTCFTLLKLLIYASSFTSQGSAREGVTQKVTVTFQNAFFLGFYYKRFIFWGARK